MFSCICPADDYDEPEVYNVKIVKARKVHRCYECGDSIPVGARHEHVQALYDGWSEYRTCLVCVTIREDFQGPGCGFVHGDLWQSLRDMYDTGNFDDDDWLY